MSWFAVIAGALIGAPLRYLIDRAVAARFGTVFPWGTLAVNLIACVGLGFLTGLVAVTTVPAAFQALIGPGLCATLSTYSTFSHETVSLARRGARLLSVANAVLSVLAGLAAAVLGTTLA